MPLFQPSFRGRLRLFFAVIVIVPMIAVGVVLFQLLAAGGSFKLDSGLAQAQKTANALYLQDRKAAKDALVPFTRSRELATAIHDNQVSVMREQLDRLARQTGAEWVKSRSPTSGRSRQVTTRPSPRRRRIWSTPRETRSARSPCRRRPRTSTPPKRRAWRSCTCGSIGAAYRWRRRCPRRRTWSCRTNGGRMSRSPTSTTGRRSSGATSRARRRSWCDCSARFPSAITTRRSSSSACWSASSRWPSCSR